MTTQARAGTDCKVRRTGVEVQLSGDGFVSTSRTTKTDVSRPLKDALQRKGAYRMYVVRCTLYAVRCTLYAVSNAITAALVNTSATFRRVAHQFIADAAEIKHVLAYICCSFPIRAWVGPACLF